MTQWITMQYVGLDVHKDSVVIPVAEEGRKTGRVDSSRPYQVRCAGPNALGKGLSRSPEGNGMNCVLRVRPGVRAGTE